MSEVVGMMRGPSGAWQDADQQPASGKGSGAGVPSPPVGGQQPMRASESRGYTRSSGSCQASVGGARGPGHARRTPIPVHIEERGRKSMQALSRQLSPEHSGAEEQ